MHKEGTGAVLSGSLSRNSKPAISGSQHQAASGRKPLRKVGRSLRTLKFLVKKKA
jgi:hypothetical protein